MSRGNKAHIRWLNLFSSATCRLHSDEDRPVRWGVFIGVNAKLQTFHSCLVSKVTSCWILYSRFYSSALWVDIMDKLWLGLAITLLHKTNANKSAKCFSQAILWLKEINCERLIFCRLLRKITYTYIPCGYKLFNLISPS